MIYNFDQLVERRGTDSIKWQLFNRDGNEDVLPLWVADMDFVSPEPVVRALQERVAHRVFGYGVPLAELREVIQGRLAELYGWHVETDDIFLIPGVVTGFNLACYAVGEPGDEVLVEPPVYPPMLSAPGDLGRRAKLVPLVEGAKRYERDLDAFEAAITERTSVFLLCSPHNPVGRVFERDELERVAEICLRHNVLICSDEIHCDLVFEEHPHTPTAALSPEVAAQTVTLFAPSKTYNIPGLSCSVCVVQNPELRAKLKATVPGLVGHVNVMGFTAALAAYRDGQAWLDQVMVYLEENRDYLMEYVATSLPGVTCHKPEGTYLAWLDCRAASIPGNPHQFFLERARVALNDGEDFGPGGEGFVRLNFACPRAILTQALERMREALVSG